MAHAQLRRACDRCHAHKLRCRRDHEGRKCARCDKAGIECVYSPPIRPRRGRLPSTPTSQGVFTNTANDIQMEQHTAISVDRSPLAWTLPPTANLLDDGGWHEGERGAVSTSTSWSTNAFLTPYFSGELNTPGLEMDVGLSVPSSDCAFRSPHGEPLAHRNITTATTINLESPHDEYSSDSTAESGGALATNTNDQTVQASNQLFLAQLQPLRSAEDTAFWVQKLSEINVQLFHHLEDMPSLELHTNLIASNPDTENIPFDDNNFKNYTVDRSLELSQLFIKTLNHLYPRFHDISSLSSPTPIITSSSLRTDTSPANVNERQEQAASRGGVEDSVTLDQASELLVLSCYMRLIETYDKLFRHIDLCTKYSITTHKVKSLCMPQMIIGTFSLPNSSATLMVAFISLMETMLSRIRDLIDYMISCQQDNDKSNGNPSDKTRTKACGTDESVSKPNSITEVTLEAIRKQELSTLELMDSVKKLVLNCNFL